MEKVNLLNTVIDNYTMSEAIEKIDLLIMNQKKSYVVTPNVDHIVQLEKDLELQNVYSHADLVLADGMPLIWISKLFKCPIKEKVSGSDIFPKLCSLANEKGYTMFLLGAKEGVAKKAAENLKNKFNNLKIVGTHSPSFGFENNPQEVQAVIDLVNQARPDILVVGLGAPKQEKFIFNYKDKLDVTISLGLGATIDFEAGIVSRAPKWMQNVGLEWFFRICQEPKRLYKRYLIDGIEIVKIIYKYRKKVNL